MYIIYISAIYHHCPLIIHPPSADYHPPSAEYHPLEIGPEIEIARGGFVMLYVFPQPEVLPNPEWVGLRPILGPLSDGSHGAAPFGTVGARHLGPPAAQTLRFWVG